MCFSAIASFSAGSVLTVAGVITTQKVTTKGQIAFAAIPFLFGIQQLCEGFVWLSLTHQEYAHWQQAATHAFLFFAHALSGLGAICSFIIRNQTTSKGYHFWLLYARFFIEYW